METKKCSKCGEVKNKSEFRKTYTFCKNCMNKERSIKAKEKIIERGPIKKECIICGKIFIAKTSKKLCSAKCVKKMKHDYYERRQEYFLLKQKEYRENNPEKIKQYIENKKLDENYKNKARIRRHRWYLKNKDKVKEYHKNRREKNREYLIKKKREYNNKNREILSFKRKQYREKNKDKISEYAKNNVVVISGKKFRLNTCSEELKPIIETLILIKNKKQYIKKEIQNG